MSFLDFMEGSSFSNAPASIERTHASIGEGSTFTQALQIIIDLRNERDALREALQTAQSDISKINAVNLSSLGLIHLFEEEIELLEQGLVTKSVLANNPQLQYQIRDELFAVAQDCSQALAKSGGRFSRKIDNLLNLLDMRLAVFLDDIKSYPHVCYQHADDYTPVPYSDGTLPAILQYVKDECARFHPQDTKPYEALHKQRILNRCYQSCQQAGLGKTLGYDTMQNFIVASGYSVQDFLSTIHPDDLPTGFATDPALDPPFTSYTKNPDNDHVKNLLSGAHP